MKRSHKEQKLGEDIRRELFRQSHLEVFYPLLLGSKERMNSLSYAE